MTDFYLEFGTPENYYVAIHKLSCAYIDHASLLGLGRLANLGNFGNSSMALGSARINHPVAARCLDCCVPDPISCSTASNIDARNNFVTA